VNARAYVCFVVIMVQYANCHGNETHDTTTMSHGNWTHGPTTDHHHGHMSTEHGTEPPSGAGVNNYWTLDSLYFNKPQKLSSMYWWLLNFLDIIDYSWNEKVFADWLHVHSCLYAALLCKLVKFYGFGLFKYFCVIAHCIYAKYDIINKLGGYDVFTSFRLTFCLCARDVKITMTSLRCHPQITDSFKTVIATDLEFYRRVPWDNENMTP